MGCKKDAKRVVGGFPGGHTELCAPEDEWQAGLGGGLRGNEGLFPSSPFFCCPFLKQARFGELVGAEFHPGVSCE